MLTSFKSSFLFNGLSMRYTNLEAIKIIFYNYYNVLLFSFFKHINALSLPKATITQLYKFIFLIFFKFSRSSKSLKYYSCIILQYNFIISDANPFARTLGNRHDELLFLRFLLPLERIKIKLISIIIIDKNKINAF